MDSFRPRLPSFPKVDWVSFAGSLSESAKLSRQLIPLCLCSHHSAFGTLGADKENHGREAGEETVRLIIEILER